MTMANTGASESLNPVLAGEDGYLFLVKGAHSVLDLCQGTHRATEASVRAFGNNLRTRMDYCARHGIAFRQVVFPEKLVALSELSGMGSDIRSIYERNYSAHVAGIAGLPNDLYPLRLMKGRKDFFLRTDTHYSAGGILALAEHLCASLGLDATDTLRNGQGKVTHSQAEFVGDLGNKFTPPVSESAVICAPFRTPRFNMASNGVMRGNDGLMILSETPDSLTDKVLLIFGDSFFRQMLPILTLVFRKIVFCRTRFFQAELVPAVAPDVIFYGQAERYLSGCRLDEDRENFLSYAWANGKPMQPQENFHALWSRIFDRKKLLQE